MNPQVSAITLAVKDIVRAKEFYTQGLGCQLLQEEGEFVSLGLGEGSSTLALYGWDALAEDAGIAADSDGFRAFTLSYIVERGEHVDTVMAKARAAGARIGKPAKRAFWGGYSGYFSDPDGYLWKVGSNKRPRRGSRRQDAEQAARQAAAVKPDETAVTIGVEDFKKVKEFYSEGLGCPIDKSFLSFASFNLGDASSTLGLYKRAALAKDAGVAANGNGFRGFTLSHVESGEQVDQMLAQAARAGGTIAKPAQAASWGGYSGYFADPDGNLWKVAAQE